MAQTTQTRPATFDHLKKKSKPQKSISIVLDDEVATELMRASAEHADAQLRLDSMEQTDPLIAGQRKLVRRLQTERDAALAAADIVTEHLTFRSIGAKRYDDLVALHPPTEQQKADAAELNMVRTYDPDTFLPALIASTCIVPVMTAEQVGELRDEWNATEYMDLVQAALEVSNVKRTVDWGKG
jgi:hypothetical protein